MHLRKYAVTFKMGVQNSIEYRTNFLLSLLSTVFPIVIQVFLWHAIFRSTTSSDIFGYSEGQVIAYSFLAALFAKLAATGFEYEVAGDVKNGQLSKFVVQPVHYFGYRLCSFLGEKCMHLLVILLITLVILGWFREVVVWEASRLAACLIALPLAITMNFLIYFNLSMISFWIIEVWGIFLTFSLIAGIASGGVFPLDMFGPAAQTVLNMLPFKYIVFFPVNVLLGKIPQAGLLPGIGLQVMWIAILAAIAAVLWHSGMRKYESAGVKRLSMVWKEAKRYALIYALFMKNSLLLMMEYRINFLFGIMIEIGFLCIKLSYAYVIYRIGVHINGVSPDQIILFIGAYTLMAGLYATFFYSNFIRLPEHVRTGTLDMMMTKPISLQFMATLRTIDIGYSIPNLVGGILLVVFGWRRSGIPFTPANTAGFIGFLLLGVVLTYAIFLIPQLISFWTVKTGGVNEISNALFDFNQMPMSIYNKTIQRAGTFVLPVFLITNLSPLYVMQRLSPGQLLWGLAAPVLFLLITRGIWRIAIRSYTSASS